jgi:hypothetical protein
MDTRVRSPARLAPPYRQVCVCFRSRQHDHRAPFPLPTDRQQNISPATAAWLPGKTSPSFPYESTSWSLTPQAVCKSPGYWPVTCPRAQPRHPPASPSSVDVQFFLPCYIEEDPSSWPMAVNAVCVCVCVCARVCNLRGMLQHVRVVEDTVAACVFRSVRAQNPQVM